MERSDAELIRAAREGDADALEELLERHEEQVYRFGLRMCGSEEDARDVLQQTLMTAFRGIHQFRGDASLSTWLYQIARSFCTKARRRKVDEPAEHVPLDAPPMLMVPTQEADPEAVVHARQMGQVLQAAILALPEAYRETLILRDVEGLSAEEAARVVGIEVGALKSRLHRARSELRKHLTALLERGEAGSGHSCPELARELSEYAADDIDQATCVRIEQHLERCPECRSACDSLKRTVSLCRHVPEGEVPAPVKAAVRHALSRLGHQAASERS
ncbi:MAG TPA: sigma-70 family RNA polymerase sigma factor [Myxococcaceae bacterium]|nr:sigma-70 family RNA polymerase sigma factor [Myxococcaceae bacterium]